jgi:hypothetical protein
MTSYNDVIGAEVGPGQWGGLVILGNAPSTKCPTDGTACALQVEGAVEGSVFGGTDSTDNSGILRYTVVKYAGFEIAPDNELTIKISNMSKLARLSLKRLKIKKRLA